MYNRLIISSFIGACVIVLAEGLRIKKLISNETSRKVLHLTHGLVVATWIFAVSYSFIIGAEVLFIVVVLLARKLRIMQSLRRVNRTSWGDIFFPLGIIASSLLTPSKLVFLAAMLHLAIADALAALVGVRSKKGEYHVLGQRKTLAGTGTFFIVSILIVAYFMFFIHLVYPLYVLLLVPVMATLAENLSVYGADNLSIPLIVICSLSLVS